MKMQMMFIRVFLPTRCFTDLYRSPYWFGNIEREIDFFRNFLEKARREFNTEDSSNYLDEKLQRIFLTQHVV